MIKPVLQPLMHWKNHNRKLPSVDKLHYKTWNVQQLVLSQSNTCCKQR